MLKISILQLPTNKTRPIPRLIDRMLRSCGKLLVGWVGFVRDFWLLLVFMA